MVDFEVDVIRGQLENIEVKAGWKRGYIIGLDKIQVVGDKIILKVKCEDL